MKHPFPDRDAITLAAGYLQSAGFRVLDRSWQTADGQLDIAAAERDVLVVCEVTTRTRTRYSTPAEPIGQARIRRLRGLAVAWMNAHRMRFEQVRVDIVSLIWEGSGGYTTEHLRGVG